jgi:hypothetical protein
LSTATWKVPEQLTANGEQEDVHVPRTSSMTMLGYAFPLGSEAEPHQCRIVDSSKEYTPAWLRKRSSMPTTDQERQDNETK